MRKNFYTTAYGVGVQATMEENVVNENLTSNVMMKEKQKQLLVRW